MSMSLAAAKDHRELLIRYLSDDGPHGRIHDKYFGRGSRAELFVDLLRETQAVLYDLETEGYAKDSEIAELRRKANACDDGLEHYMKGRSEYLAGNPPKTKQMKLERFHETVEDLVNETTTVRTMPVALGELIDSLKEALEEV